LGATNATEAHIVDRGNGENAAAGAWGCHFPAYEFYNLKRKSRKTCERCGGGGKVRLTPEEVAARTAKSG